MIEIAMVIVALISLAGALRTELAQGWVCMHEHDNIRALGASDEDCRAVELLQWNARAPQPQPKGWPTNVLHPFDYEDLK